MRLLLVEDDPVLAGVLAEGLKEQGIEVVHAASFGGGRRLALAGRYDLIILDAFSSDNVPAHLLTREAMQTYRRVMRPGGIIVFDDYGWSAYHRQKVSADEFMRERGHSVLELPTGQGMVVKR